MAFESRFWRSLIRKDIDYLRKKIEIKLDFENEDNYKIDESISYIEIKLFNIAYGLRKLLDHHKIPNKVNANILKVNFFSKRKNYKDGVFDLLYNPDFDERYDLSHRREETIRLRALCNHFIHAKIFQPYANRLGAVKYLFFVSDDKYEKKLYSVDIKRLLRFFKRAIDTQVKSISISKEKGIMVV